MWWVWCLRVLYASGEVNLGADHRSNLCVQHEYVSSTIVINILLDKKHSMLPITQNSGASINIMG